MTVSLASSIGAPSSPFDKLMPIRITFVCSILLALASFPLTGFTDTIYLKNGKTR